MFYNSLRFDGSKTPDHPSLSDYYYYYSTAQIATLISVYANWSFAAIEGIGWGWAGVIWLYNLVFYFPLDIIKFTVRYALSGKAWDLIIEQRVRMLSI